MEWINMGKNLLEDHLRSIRRVCHKEIGKHQICEKLCRDVAKGEGKKIMGERSPRSPLCRGEIISTLCMHQQARGDKPLSRMKSMRASRRVCICFQTASWSSRSMYCFLAAWASFPTDWRCSMSDCESWVKSERSCAYRQNVNTRVRNRYYSMLHTVAFPLQRQ